MHNLALVDVVAFNSVLVQREALIALATVTTDRVLASSVEAHPGKLDALVDVVFVGETVPPGAHLVVSMTARFRTGFASFAAPCTTNRATTQTLGKLPFDRIRALAVTILHETGLLSRVYARGMCRVQSQPRRTLATIGTISVDTGTSTFAYAGVQLALVHVHAILSTEFRVPLRTLAEIVIANFTGTSPSNPHGTTALRFQRQSR